MDSYINNELNTKGSKHFNQPFNVRIIFHAERRLRDAGWRSSARRQRQSCFCGAPASTEAGWLLGELLAPLSASSSFLFLFSFFSQTFGLLRCPHSRLSSERDHHRRTARGHVRTGRDARAQSLQRT